MRKNKWLCLAAFVFAMHQFAPLLSQSIAEKKASLRSSGNDLNPDMDQFLKRVNHESKLLQNEINDYYKAVWVLYENHASATDYEVLLDKINENKRELYKLEKAWKDLAISENRGEAYGLWHAPETSLEQLIIDYGSQDYVYLIPPEVGGIRLSIDSNLPIPRASWNEMLEMILTENGVGIRTLNPYLRQLYLLKQDRSHLRLITNQRQDLEVLPKEARISFVLSPEPSEVRRTYFFLKNFVDPNSTLLQMLGRDILVIGQVREVEDLLKLYDFVATNRGEKDYRLIPIQKIPAEEMARIIDAAFDQGEEEKFVEKFTEGERPPEFQRANPNSSSGNGLKVIPIREAQALFVVGTREEVRKAEDVVRNVESQIGGARDREIYWYKVKHSDPIELADVLAKIYTLMVTLPIAPGEINGIPGNPQQNPNEVNIVTNNTTPIPPYLQQPRQLEPPLLLYGQEGYYQEGGYVVNPAPAQPGVILPNRAPNADRDNFIVDLKTGSIVMVVESDILPRIKDLIKKMDVLKQMVQIETLLFEKVLTRETDYGLNLLRVGDLATNTVFNGAAFNNLFPVGGQFTPSNAGVFDYLISRKQSGSVPAFDLAYRFLLTTDDIQINNCPTVLTVNQSPATISVSEDISINTGIFEVETVGGGVALKDAFTRAQYGTTISIKPSVHLTDESDEANGFIDYYVSMETDITFDTIHPGGDPSRPNVTRRHVTNLVQVADGETAVIGGLRRKTLSDHNDGVPFIGELPGIGKLFSQTSMNDSSTEMFIFITPRVVRDPKEEVVKARQELLSIRPGDIPYFLCCVEQAFQYEKHKLMEQSMRMLFGRQKEKCYISDDEYDGRE